MGDSRIYLVVFIIQAISSGMILLSKAAFNNGINVSVFVFYRQAAGILFLVPLALFLERDRAKLSLKVFSKIFLLAFIGITMSLNIYGIALDYTSASLGTATVNIAPVTTFAIALLLGMEKLDIKKVHGVAKVAGLIVCIGGVVVMSLYKGPAIRPFLNLPWTPNSIIEDHISHKWILGCFLLLVSSICWGLWLSLQARVMKEYPSKLTFSALQCLSSVVQTFLVAIAVEHDFTKWKLGWNVDLIAISYCGVTSVAYYLQVWVIDKKGPVFYAMTAPINVVLTTFGSFFFLGEAIHLGCILGSILLVTSLYTVLWGKRREEKQIILTYPDEEGGFTENKELEAAKT